MELRDLETFGEPGAVVYLADCIDLMRLMPAGSVDAVFADPPYRLSNGGVTVKNGRVSWRGQDLFGQLWLCWEA